MFEESSSTSSLDPLQMVSNTTLAHSHLQLPTMDGEDVTHLVDMGIARQAFGDLHEPFSSCLIGI